jgi:orotidine-5'-phosphate decarboxylase
MAFVNDPAVTPIVALDVPTAARARQLVEVIGDRCRFYKIGSQLFSAAGPDLVLRLIDEGCDIFLDLKYHDIPNTVRGAVQAASDLGVRLLTVHAVGGRSMLEAARDAAGDRCGVLAVTVLTSLDAAALGEAWGRPGLDVEEEVLRLAELAAATGVYGVVCSARESALVRDRFGDRLARLVPGIRLAGGDVHDQSRVATPAEARAAGANYVVIGRAVTGAERPGEAMDAVRAALAR